MHTRTLTRVTILGRWRCAGVDCTVQPQAPILACFGLLSVWHNNTTNVNTVTYRGKHKGIGHPLPMGAELHVIMRSGVLRLNVCLQDFWIPQFLFYTPKVTYIEFCCTDAAGWVSGSVCGHKKIHSSAVLQGDLWVIWSNQRWSHKLGQLEMKTENVAIYCCYFLVLLNQPIILETTKG